MLSFFTGIAVNFRWLVYAMVLIVGSMDWLPNFNIGYLATAIDYVPLFQLIKYFMKKAV
jgi:hypothetical protein